MADVSGLFRRPGIRPILFSDLRPRGNPQEAGKRAPGPPEQHDDVNPSFNECDLFRAQRAGRRHLGTVLDSRNPVIQHAVGAAAGRECGGKTASSRNSCGRAACRPVVPPDRGTPRSSASGAAGYPSRIRPLREPARTKCSRKSRCRTAPMLLPFSRYVPSVGNLRAIPVLLLLYKRLRRWSIWVLPKEAAEHGICRQTYSWILP
jgi:hypothetical protein